MLKYRAGFKDCQTGLKLTHKRFWLIHAAYEASFLFVGA
ncbi:hypothetical protein EBME_0854 [bacterium endosymbiont of Mortierella elongata FMR23-6]|nr:hypothetical protein EBME_0854 [bacterium endosymbiont of Mortierella elongata FMR23-6]